MIKEELLKRGRLQAEHTGDGIVETPKVHGLCASRPASAAHRHARELVQRDGLLVVKDGGDADRSRNLEGVGLAAAAPAVAAAEHQGVLDLDTPPLAYGTAAPRVRGSRGRKTSLAPTATASANGAGRGGRSRGAGSGDGAALR